MPFFPGRKKNTNKNTTLQVRIPSKENKKIKSCVKRVSPFAFSRIRGSLTVEAALCLPLLIFVMVILMLPMKIMNTRRQIQAGLEAANEELCQYAYLELNGAAVTEQAALQSARGRALAAADALGLQFVSMSRSSVLEDGETIDLILDYEVELPFPILTLSTIPQSVRSRRRAWIGRPGGESGAGEGIEKDDPMVYLGKGSTRYHRSRDCHYLSNQLQSVSKEQAAAMQSISGSRYSPCAVCGAGDASVVHIMPNGSRYHTQVQCRAIIAYVQSVRLSEAVHLGGCSYCVK